MGEDKIGFWDAVKGWTIVVLIFGSVASGIYYLSSAPYDAFEMRLISGGYGWIILLAGAVVVVLAGSSAIDQFNWHGPLPAPAAEGYAWRRSIRSRLESLVNLAWIVVVGHSLALTPYVAGQHQDWGRMVLSALLVGAMAYGCLLAILSAVSPKIVLTMDSEGFRGVGMPGGAVRWDSIERLSVGGRMEARELTMYGHGPDGERGKAHSISLAAAGIPVSTFIERAAELAPQVEVSMPAPRMADFSAA